MTSGRETLDRVGVVRVAHLGRTEKVEDPQGPQGTEDRRSYGGGHQCTGGRKESLERDGLKISSKTCISGGSIRS